MVDDAINGEGSIFLPLAPAYVDDSGEDMLKSASVD
jgi:hypothetical protein